MQVAQPTIYKLGYRDDNASLIIEERPGIDLAGGTGHDWGLYVAVLERISEEAFLELCHPTTYPRLSVDEPPKYETVTAPIDLGAHLTVEEDTLIDEMLPRLAERTLPAELILTIGGRGKPTFRIETEISLYDED